MKIRIKIILCLLVGSPFLNRIKKLNKTNWIRIKNIINFNPTKKWSENKTAEIMPKIKE